MELRNRFEILQREEPEDDETDQPEVELEKANNILEKAYNMTAKKVVEYKTKKVKPWISNESWDLIEQRKANKNKTRWNQLRETERKEASRIQSQRSRSEEADTQGQEELVRRDSKRSRGSSKYATHEDSLQPN